MKGTVIRSFVAKIPGATIRGVEGEVIDILDPSWIRAGFVVPIRGATERAVVRPAEKAVDRESSRGH